MPHATYLIHGTTAADNDGATAAASAATLALASSSSAGSTIAVDARRALLHAARLGEWIALGT